MSLLSRLIAVAEPEEIAAAVEALLPAGGPGAPAGDTGELPAGAPERPRISLSPVGLGTTAGRFPQPPGPTLPPPEPAGPPIGGPNGLGTSATRVAAQPSGTSSSSETRIPELYCPAPVRDDEALAKVVDDRLIEWAEEVGIYPGKLETVRSLSVGRLIMLTHPDSDDPDRLLAAAECALAEWATDDHYVDDESLGADPYQLAGRLVVANAVVDPAQLPTRYAPDLEAVVQDDPVLIAYRSSLANLARYASPAQVRRLRQELAVMFLAYNQEGEWRTEERTPAAWEYVVHRNENSFLPPMVLIDVVGGYEVSQAEFSDPRVRRIFTMAGLATVLVNDLFSVAKEQSGPDFNLPKLIAAEEGCGVQEAMDRTAEVHDELAHSVEAESALLIPGSSPALQRFLAGIWAWMGGNHEWHRTSPRYNTRQDAANPQGGASV